MIEHLLWYFQTHAYVTGLTPMFRAAFACWALYQVDFALVLSYWLLRKLGVFEAECRLEPEQRRPALLLLPTLLREEADLRGLQHAVESAAHNGYPAPLTIVTCIDGAGERPALFERLERWAREVCVPEGVRLYVARSDTRVGKAVTMEAGVSFVRALVARGELPGVPEVFFNMDADSTLGERALERMAYRLTRKRLIARAPRMIVTSNVVVPLEQCITPDGGIRWIPLSVAREYLSSITYSKFNWKLFPCTCVSGALYCTWTAIHLQAPYYASFMQTLTVGQWARWWLGAGPPRFSEYRGEPLPEAMSGPGDDTWVAWLACTARFRRGELDLDPPATPLHAFGRLLLWYVSRPVSYDPLAKVYTKTPVTQRALFKQRLRWNSSRIQDLKRWCISHLYHWNVGFPVFLATFGLAIGVGLLVAGLLAVVLFVPNAVLPVPFFVLLALGYSATRVTSSVAALIVSESRPSEWLKLIALIVAGPYHLWFNTTTLSVGYVRDILGFGEPTTFAPEETLRRSRLSRVALAYRLRRAFWLAVRAVRYGDVPFGAFWFGWRETPWTPSGFDGWSSGRRPPPIRWPETRSATQADVGE